MSDLDSKLDYILKSNAAVQRCADKDALNDYDKLIPAIKQAFSEAGYLQIPMVEVVTRYKQGKKPEVFMVNGKEVMSGQEWYDRFEAELTSQTNVKTQFSWLGIMIAAKRASGLDK